MGNENSKDSSDSSTNERPSRLSRFKRKLHFRRPRNSGSTSLSHHKLFTADDFAGIAILTLIGAEMKFKDRWLGCVSFGEQTFRTEKSENTDKPIWNSEKKLLLERNGPHIARISVFETNRVSKNNLIGYCEIDLLEFLTRDSDSDFEVFYLFNPSSPDVVVGNISLSCSVEDRIETEKSFARRILSIVDYDEDGKLSFSEFCDLISAFGNQVAASKKEELFRTADRNGDGVVSMDELAALLALQQEKEPLMNCCPVCGEVLEVDDKLNTMIHLTLCFDEGTGNQVMTGGFLTDKQASYGWMFKLSEWGHFSSYDVGLNSGSSASHILVFDRRTKRLVEELIDGKIILSMRAIYQSKVGLGLMDIGTKELLKSISEKQGKKMNSVESSKDIPKFIEFFKDQINLAELKYPLEHFKTFNEFFIRELKPGARTIASLENDEVAVCAADSRLIAFKSAEDSLRFWIKDYFDMQRLKVDKEFVVVKIMETQGSDIHMGDLSGVALVKAIDGEFWTVIVHAFDVNCPKGNKLVNYDGFIEDVKGRKFSIHGLLGKEICSDAFINGSLVIFRLAPQDYHRFHFPVSGVIERMVDIPGCLYTVNPIAVNSKYCNVFTENKRVVSIISTANFGKVAFIAIGATMVGSITFLKKEGDFAKKGDEFGYFSFGGSTVICIFEKDAIKIDEDLLANSGRSLETLVSVGMSLGVCIKEIAEPALPNLEKIVL